MEQTEFFNKPKVCFLYLLTAVDDVEPCKVGITTNPEFRLRKLQTGNPKQLCMRIIYRFQDVAEAFLAEQLILAHFHRDRAVGEWVNKGWDEINRSIGNLLSQALPLFADEGIGAIIPELHRSEPLIEHRDVMADATGFQIRFNLWRLALPIWKAFAPRDSWPARVLSAERREDEEKRKAATKLNQNQEDLAL